MNRTLSRREKKKPTDGVTLTGINQTGDQALQNKPSRWVRAPPSLGPRHGPGHRPQLGHLGVSPVGPHRVSHGRLSSVSSVGEASGHLWEDHLPTGWSCRKIQRGALATHALGPK